MYVVYESPQQMLADSPSNYIREQDCMEFMARAPTVWDETCVLQAKVGDYVAVARRSKDEWYVGAMTDEASRDQSFDLSLLSIPGYVMDFDMDGVNADRYAGDFEKMTSPVAPDQRLKVHLAPG